MISKLVVLGRVEDFKQRSARITPCIFTHLVDLIKEEHGVISSNLLQ